MLSQSLECEWTFFAFSSRSPVLFLVLPLFAIVQCGVFFHHIVVVINANSYCYCCWPSFIERGPRITSARCNIASR